MKLTRIALTLSSESLWDSQDSAFSRKGDQQGTGRSGRGPDGSGISNEKNLPSEWSPNEEHQMENTDRRPSAFVADRLGQQSFLTTAIEGEVVPGAKAVKHMLGDKEFVHPDSIGANKKHTFKVICLDRDTGKILWQANAWEGTPYDDRHRKSSYAASTPATDGKMVYAFFGTEGLYAYDFKGKLAWKAHLGNIATVGMGTGTSPILFENLVIVQADEDNGAASFIVALDKKTGKEVWKTPRKGTSELVHSVAARTRTRGVDRERNRIGDCLRSSDWQRVVATQGRREQRDSFARGKQRDGVSRRGFPAKIAMAIRLGQTGDLTGTPNVPWKYEKGTAYVPSPILYGDYLYLTTDRGILTAIDAKTGEVKYEGGRIPIPATFTASPVAFEGKILMTSEDGDTFIVKAGPKHEVIGTNSVGEPVYASPAIADGRIFIRGEKNLYCIGN